MRIDRHGTIALPFRFNLHHRQERTMSSIPNAKMKHAHVAEPEQPGVTPKAPKADKAAKVDGPSLSDRAKELGERAQDLAEEAVDAVKARPKTAAAIGAAIVAGAAAIIGGPAAARALKSDKPKKAPAAKKTAAKKPAAKKA
ncbi:hypothetical protein [Sphingomonas sp.]|uniref:hypothetical protein n=1 Tax=Sphingomonas sp. TaxID=28214 RepID=UPI003B004DEB